MKNKFFRYYLYLYSERTVGIINADDEEEAWDIIKKNYGKHLPVEKFKVEEVVFDDGMIELYYGG